MIFDPGLATGCTLVSLGVTYAIWSSFRVWSFRQDLFQIRDNLWDRMRACDAFSDPAYQEFRAGVNALIRIAPMLSIFTLIKLLLDRDEMHSLLRDSGHIPEIEAARGEIFQRTAQYLLRESLVGLVLTTIALIFGMAGLLKRAVAKRVAWLFDNRIIQALDEHMATA